MKISTSILSASDRKSAIQKLNQSNTDYIHIDVMDGKFVNNFQMPLKEILEYEKISEKKLDIHLMVKNPNKYIRRLKKKNIEYITIHYEINKNKDKIIKKIKNMGYKVGLAINPDTNIEAIKEYLDNIDLLLIMTVNPGQGGQKFMEKMIDKAINIKKEKNITIEMDGGINNETIKKIKNIIDISVAGSYITNNPNYNEAINNLKN